MHKVFSRIGFFAFAVLILGMGCASIMSGGQQPVSFSTSPDEARIRVLNSDGMEVGGGRTPVTIQLARGDGFFKAASYRVIFEKDGYEKKEIFVKGDLNAGWYIVGNLFLGGWLGWLIIDPLTGAMWTLNPEHVTTGLDVVKSGDAISLKIALADQVPPELMAQAVYVGMAE